MVFEVGEKFWLISDDTGVDLIEAMVTKVDQEEETAWVEYEGTYTHVIQKATFKELELAMDLINKVADWY